MFNSMRYSMVVSGALCAALGAGCGDVAREGRGPTQAVILALEGAPGVTPEGFGGTLSSDVVTLVKKDNNGVKIKVPTIFGDLGRVTMSLTLKDPGTASTPTSPSTLNRVTFGRYRVVYVRADGRNTPGVDVPYPFDSAATFTVAVGESTKAGFDLVRITAKQEAPLQALETNSTFITTIAEVTFYGQDLAGNEVTAAGRIGVTFGNFGDPE